MYCTILDDAKSTRVIGHESLSLTWGGSRQLKAASVTGLANGWPSFLAAESFQAFISGEMKRRVAPIEFATGDGVRALAYEADLLPLVCEAYVAATRGNAVHQAQRPTVDACNLLIRGLAGVGIVALVDEASGFQADRARDELVNILEAYVAPQLMPWVRRFPPSFFEQIYRLQGWSSNRGQLSGPPESATSSISTSMGGLPRAPSTN
jgi:hypothetical protein